MRRRNFLSRFWLGASALAAVAVLPAPTMARSVAEPASVDPFAEPIPIRRVRNGCAFVLGVATETVAAGDFVEVQTYGPASVRIANPIVRYDPPRSRLHVYEPTDPRRLPA